MAEPTDIEKKSLEAHVELCAERYRALESQFTEVKKDIGDVKELAEKTHNLVNQMAERRSSQLINWGVGIIGTLVTIVGYLLVTYVLNK